MGPNYLNSILAAGAIFGLFGVLGGAQADVHQDGHGKIIGKGDGKHHLHTTPDGHVAHAHVTNGKVTMVSVAHQGKNLQVKKYKSNKKLHAMANQPGGDFTRVDGAEVVNVFAADTGAETESSRAASAQVTVFIGFGFLNTFTNQLVIFWFPIEVVDGGDFGAIVIGGGGPVVVPGPVLNVNGNVPAGGTTSYNVNLQAGVQYTISLNKLQNGYDPYLWLYDPVGQLVAQDDDSGGNLNARIIYTPNVSGTFQIKCGSFNNSSGGTFNLKVN